MRKYETKESVIEKKVCTYAESKGCQVKKFRSINAKGMPDKIFIMPTGVVFFIEFKRRNNYSFAKLQKQVCTELEAMGANIFVVKDFESGKALIDKCFEAIKIFKNLRIRDLVEVGEECLIENY